MVKHIILWKIKDEFSAEEKLKIKSEAKKALEELNKKIDGLINITVNISPLSSSNAEMMLDSSFEDEKSLKAYQTHPLHQQAANTYVRPFTCERMCMDYEA